ncbi:DUF6049 family protein [Leucobacter sp. W1038]|uniref:DUF6049 family protein n=1 Tax=Leucobacter sp. W1038 TaxID=3438281 RepID=UPI003D999390
MSRAPRQRPRRRLASRRSLARACTAALLTAVLTLAASTAAGASGTGTESETTAVTAELVVAPALPVFDTGEEDYQFTVLLRNTGQDAISAGELRLLLHPERLESAAQLTSGEPSAQVTQIARSAVSATASGGEQTLTLTVPREFFPLNPLSQRGVYTVHVELRLPSTEPLETRADPLLVSEATPFVWQDSGTETRVPVTLVVPFTLPGSVRTMPSAEQLREIAPRLTSLLDEAERAGATLAVDPRIVAGTRVLGEDAPASARDLLDRLEASAQPLFMLQFADADPAAQAALGLEQLLQPLGLSYLLRGSSAETGTEEAPGSDSTTDTSEGDDTAPSEGGSPPADSAQIGGNSAFDGAVSAPSIDELSALPRAIPGAWPAAGGVDTATLDLLRNGGISRVVLDSGSVADATGTRVPIGDFSALVADASLSESSRRTLAGNSPSERAAGIASLASRLALEALQGSPGLVLAVDRGALADSEDPAEFLTSVLGLGWVDSVPETLQPVGTGMIRSGETLEQRREFLRATIGRSDEIDELAPLLTRPQYLLEYQRVRLLEAFATRYANADVDFDVIDDRIRARDAELLTGVQIVGTENTQLVGTSSRVPVTLHNALPFDARVTLKVAPTSAGIAIPARAFPDQLVGAEGNHVVLVGVNTRVSSGESGLRVELTDVAGEQAFAERVLKLTIRSSYETILLTSLSTIALLLLGFGIWRSLRRRERATPADAAAKAADAKDRTQASGRSPEIHLPRE